MALRLGSVAEWWFIKQFTPAFIYWRRPCLFFLFVFVYTLIRAEDWERSWHHVGKGLEILCQCAREMSFQLARRWDRDGCSQQPDAELRDCLDTCVFLWLVLWIISCEVVSLSSWNSHPSHLKLLNELLLVCCCFLYQMDRKGGLTGSSILR